MSCACFAPLPPPGCMLAPRSISDPAGKGAVHGRRLAALKALVSLPSTSDEAFTALVHLIFTLLDEINKGSKQRRRRSLFSRGSQDKEAVVKGSLHYAALSALRRLPMDPTSEELLERAVLGIGCADPVGVRHALAMVSEIARSNPANVAYSLGHLAGGSLAEAIKVNDVFARVYLARLCGTLIHAPQLYDRADLRGLFSAILFQLLHDPAPRVALETINCICGDISGEGSTDQRADGWQILTTSVTDSKIVAKKAKGADAAPPSSVLVLKVAALRLELMLRSPSRPMLHGALRCVAVIGRARAAAHMLGILTEDTEAPSDDALDFAQAMGKVGAAPKKPETVDQMLGALMECVRIVVACECVYVRAQALKAMIWMQSEYESSDELKATLGGELADPSWPPGLLNELLMTLHARFKAAPSMAVMVLDLATLLVHRAPAKVDTHTLQGLWKMCLTGIGPEGKHLALDAVSNLVDLPPPPPPPRGAASDPRSAMALQRLVLAAIWFLGENANYAAAEYAWESSTPPGAALMMLDTERMVAASGIRNPTIVAAIQRLQRCAMVGSWPERVVAAHGLITVAIRSGEPYRLQIYEFLHALVYGGLSSKEKIRGLGSGASNGEDRGASGTGLAGVISPMLRVLDEMYQAQDEMMNAIRQHEFSKEAWSDAQLKRVYDDHERLMDLALLVCFLPRSKYLPLGPVSAQLVNAYRDKHQISAAAGPDPAVQEGIDKLLSYAGPRRALADAFPVTLLEVTPDEPPPTPGVDRVNDFMGGAANEAPEGAEEYDEAQFSNVAVSFDEIWASSLLEANEDAESVLSSDSGSPTSTTSSSRPASFSINKWDEQSYSGQLTPGGQPVRDLSEPPRSDSPRILGEERGGRRDTDNELYKSVASNFSTGSYEESNPESDAARADHPVGRALYEFFASDEDELDLAAGEEIVIEYEVDGWYHVRKKTAGPSGKIAGLVPVLYVQTL